MKRLVKKVLATTMATAMAFSVTSVALADGVNGTGNGYGYAPEDIIDVVVPTKFDTAFNPLMIDLKGSIQGFEGKTEIVSGTYAIENRSTIPVNVEVALTVTPGDAALLASDEAVETFNNTASNFAVDSDSKASFSLGMITTAAGAAQKPNAEPEDKADDSTDDMRADTVMDTAKLAKAATEAIPVANATGTKVKFWLDKGPYTPKLVPGTKNDSGAVTAADKVVYEYKKGASFDTVAFTFTGMTSKNIDKWAAVIKANKVPTIKATYTFAKSNDIEYNANGYSPIWKGVALADSDAKGGEISDSNGKITFDKDLKASGDLKYTKGDTPAVDLVGNKLEIKSLQTDGKKVSLPLAAKEGDNKTINLGVVAAGVVVTEADADDADGKTEITIDYNKLKDVELTKGVKIPSGFYLVTCGKATAIIKYTAPTA